MNESLSEALSLPLLSSNAAPTAIIESESIRPNKYGATHICSPPPLSIGADKNKTSLSKILFRYCPPSEDGSPDGGVIQCLFSQHDGSLSLRSQIPLKGNVINMACSSDGRLLLVALLDTSIHCYDVTFEEEKETVQMQLRWAQSNVHSTTRRSIDSKTFSTIAQNPIHSLDFCHIEGSYLCLLVDACAGELVIFDARIRQESGRVLIQSKTNDIFNEMDITAAAWKATLSDSPTDKQLEIAIVGNSSSSDGSTLSILTFDPNNACKLNLVESVDIPPFQDCNYDSNSTEEWNCTHVNWFDTHQIAIGFYRVIPSDDDDYSDDEDDAAEHEANLLFYNCKSYTWEEMGDVTPFFAVPKNGRHSFYTQNPTLYTEVSNDSSFLLVACNLTNEIAILTNLSKQWQLCDVQDGNSATTPTTAEDEFTYPTGINCLACPESHKIMLGLSSTDGAITSFGFKHRNDTNFGISMKKIHFALLGTTVGYNCSSSTSYPPLSTNTPTPISATIRGSKEITSSIVSSSSSYPPVSKAAPKPFSSAYPPVSTKAPTPFGSSKLSNDGSASKPGSGGFSFGSNTTNTSTGGFSFGTSLSATANVDGEKTQQSSIANVFGKGLTFGESSSTTKATATNTTATVNTVSPFAINKSSPSPVIAKAETKKIPKNSSSAASSAYPPISMKAPTPFGGSTTTSGVEKSVKKAGSKASTSPSSVPSTKPPVSAKAPAPAAPTSFGLENAAGDFDNEVHSNFANQMYSGTISPSVSVATVDYVAASKYEIQFWDLVRHFRRTLHLIEKKSFDSVDQFSVNGGSMDDRQINSFIQEIQKVKSLYDVCLQGLKSHEKCLLLLQSSKNDTLRQLEESDELIQIQSMNKGTCKDHPLDKESVMMKNQINIHGMKVQKILSLLEEKMKFTEGICFDGSNKPNYLSVPSFGTMNAARRSNVSDKQRRAVKTLFQSLKTGYERTSFVDERTIGLYQKVEATSKKSIPKTTMTFTRGSRIKHRRIEPLPFLSPIKPIVHNNECAKNKKSRSISQSLRSLQKLTDGDTVKRFSSDITSSYPLQPKKEKYEWRRSSNSKLMTTFNTFKNQSSPKDFKTGVKKKSYSAYSEKPLFQQRVWNDPVDQRSMETAMSFSLPTTLMSINASKAANDALAPFGTTPEKMKKVEETNQRGHMKAIIETSIVNEKNTITAPVVSSSMDTTNLSKVTKDTLTSFGITQEKMKKVEKTHQSGHTNTKSILEKRSSTVNVTEKSNSSSITPPIISSSINTTNVSKVTKDTLTPFGITQEKTKKVEETHQRGHMKSIFEVKSSTIDANVTEKSTSVIIPSVPLNQSDTGKPQLVSNDPNNDDSSYEVVLAQFYKKYNPSKTKEVKQTLEKYKGNEIQLFSKLAKKYNAPNPLDQHTQTNPTQNLFNSFPNRGEVESSFEAMVDSKTNNETMVSEMASDTNTSSSMQMSSNVFETAPPAVVAPFGAISGTENSTSMFGRSSMFNTPSSQSPFTATNPVVSPPDILGDKSARSIVTEFYQKYNPQKISEIDKVLKKYAGKEEMLLRNLAKKYNVDPSTLGLPSIQNTSSTNTIGFGQSQSFGQTSGLGTSSGFGSQAKSSGFGSFASQNQTVGSHGFASLSAGTSASNFGGAAFSDAATPTFGNSPFGAARR